MNQLARAPARILQWCGLRHARNEPRAVYVLVAATAVGVFELARRVLPSNTGRELDGFIPEHVTIMTMHESWNARTAHVLALVSILVVALVAAFVSARARRRQGIALPLDPVTAAVLLFGVLLWVYARRIGCETVVAACLVSVLLCLLVRLPRRWAEWVSAMLLLAAAGLYVGLVLWVPVGMPEGGIGRLYAEWHYSFVLGAADYLAHGNPLTENSRFYYGVLGPALLGWVGRYAFELQYTDYLTIVQWGGLLYLVLCVVALVLWTRAWPAAAVLLMAILLPYVSPIGHFVQLFPNQTPYRFLAVPLGVLALVAVRRVRPRWRSPTLGTTLGLLLLLSAEIGLVFAVAYSAHQVVLNRLLAWRTHARRLAVLWGSALAVLGAFALAFLLAFGRVPGDLWGTFLPLAVITSQSYGGLEWKPGSYTIISLGMLGISGYLLFRCYARWQERPLTHREAVQCAVAIFVALWLIRFVNRPTGSYLWPYLFPVLLLLSGALRGRNLRRPLVGVALVVLLVGYLPTLGPYLASSKSAATRVLGAPRPTAGASLGTAEGDQRFADPVGLHGIEDKVRFLEAHREQRPLVLTLYSFTVPSLAGYWNTDIYLAPFPETFTEVQRRRLIEGILASDHTIVMFDALPPNVRRLRKFQPAFEYFDKIRLAISTRFEHVSNESGWEVWIRKQS